MKHVVPSIALCMLVAGSTQRCAWGETGAAITGVVCDVHGVPQAGALVELLGPATQVIGHVLTDEHGRYSLRGLHPGSYQVRASAAYLLPVTRGNLHLHAGVRSVADLTMTAIFEAAALLPTEKRSSVEPKDDWRWTLRSTAARPLLRLAADDTGVATSGISSSAEHRPENVGQGQFSVLAGDGSFGEGGAHQVLVMDRAGADGDVSALRATLSNNLNTGSASDVTLSTGLEKQRLFGGSTRVFVSFSSHPELESGAATGLQVLRTAATETLALGDLLDVDAGTLMTAEHSAGARLSSAPYLRVAFHVSDDTTVEYRMATSRVLQRSEDLDGMELREEALENGAGRPVLPRGLHQEVAVRQAQGHDVFTLAAFHDSAFTETVHGGGLVAMQDLNGLPVLVDPATATLHIAMDDPAGYGVRTAWERTLTPVLSACIEGAYGGALASDGTSFALAGLPLHVARRGAGAVNGAVKLHVKRSGTGLMVHYRYQKSETLTQVAPYDALSSDAYLGMTMQQRLWSGRHLKQVNALVHASNLLAEGYQSVASPGGQVLFVAQAPRAVQGGLAFSF